MRKEGRGRRGEEGGGEREEGRGCVWFKPEGMNQYTVEMTVRHTP